MNTEKVMRHALDSNAKTAVAAAMRAAVLKLAQEKS